MKLQRKIGNGTLTLPLMRGSLIVVGGPYDDRPTTLYGVKLAQEIKAACEIDLPIRDFSVPDAAKLNVSLLRLLIEMQRGTIPYIGCMGGRGRTGLMLACLAKAWGIDNPVEFVRKNYFHHAVETAEQFKWVSDWKVPADVTRMVRRMKWMSLLFGSPQRRHPLVLKPA